jgi:hypothetical protein
MPLSAQLWTGAPFMVGVLWLVPRIEVADLGAVAVILGGLVSASLSARLPDPRRRQTLYLLAAPLVGLAGWGLLTAPFALSPPLAGYTALQWSIAVGVLWAWWRCQPSGERVATVVLLTLSLHALIGIGQVLKQAPLGLPGELALDLGRSGASIVDLDAGHLLRAYGLTFHPNVLGGFLAFGLVVSLPLLHRRYWHPLWWLLWVGLLLTFSRAAWLGTALVVPLAGAWLAWKQRDLRPGLAQAALGLVIIVISGGWIWRDAIGTRLDPIVAHLPAPRAAIEHLPAAEQRALAERAELNDIGLRLALAHPVTGVGAGNFPVAMAALPRFFPPDHVHNVGLLLASEIGLAGGLLWVFLWVAAIGVALPRGRTDRWTVVFGGAALLLAVVSALDAYPWASQAGRMLTVTVLGMLSLSERGEPL